MKRKKVMRMLASITLSLVLLAPGLPAQAATIKGTGTSRTRSEWVNSDKTTTTTTKVPRKDKDGNQVYLDPDLTGGWTYDTSKGTKDQQSKTSDPWHLTRVAQVDTPGVWVDQTYTYTVSVPTPYDESKWTNQPISIVASDSDYLDAEPDFVGSNVGRQLITREGQKGHSESPDNYPAIANLHTAWNGNDWQGTRIAQSTGTTGTTATDNIEGATEWKIWTHDNLYTDKDGIYPRDLGLPYVMHYTAENHLLKYDKTKPVVSQLKITQNRLKDVGVTGQYLATQTRPNESGESRNVLSDQTIAQDLDQKMTTTIALNISDQNPDAFHGGNDVSGIQTIVVTIKGNNGKQKTLRYVNGGASDFTRSSVTRNRENSADSKATYTWTGNLYKDPDLSGATDLIVTVEVTDQGGNKQTTFGQDKVVNNHKGDDIGSGGSSTTFGGGDNTHMKNYDAVSSIYRNDILNEKYNGAYVTKNPNSANQSVKTTWEQAGYQSYKAYFDANYNTFKYSEYATVKAISYGSSVDGYSTDFNYGGAGMADLVNVKKTIYEQSPVINRAFGETDASEAGNTVSQTIGTTKFLTYNTRFPVVSNADKGTYKEGTLRYGLDLALQGATEKAYVRPEYKIGYKKNPPIFPPSLPDDIHVRISTNHGNGNLEYK